MCGDSHTGEHEAAEKPVEDSPEVARLVEKGEWGSIWYAQRQNGGMEAKQWLDAQGASVRAKFSHLFRAMAATGKIYNKEQFRFLEDGIYEFKRNGDRILAFQKGSNWYLTHHFKKSVKKCPPAQIARAIEIRGEFLEILKAEASKNDA